METSLLKLQVYCSILLEGESITGISNAVFEGMFFRVAAL